MGVCEERFPALAKHLKRVAKSKGFTFKHHAELQDADNNRAAAQAITYTERDDAVNAYKQQNKTAQGIFEKSNPPEVVAFWKREAQPLRLPWQRGHVNLTRIGQLHKTAPELAQVVQRGQQIEGGWINDQLAMAKAQEADAIASRREAEALLQAK
jgi:phage gp29-like protein